MENKSNIYNTTRYYTEFDKMYNIYFMYKVIFLRKKKSQTQRFDKQYKYARTYCYIYTQNIMSFASQQCDGLTNHDVLMFL